MEVAPSRALRGPASGGRRILRARAQMHLAMAISVIGETLNEQGDSGVDDLLSSGRQLRCADKEWEDTGSTWGSAAARTSPAKAADTPPRSRPPSGGRAGMQHAGSSGSIKSQVRIMMFPAFSHWGAALVCKLGFVVCGLLRLHPVPGARSGAFWASSSGAAQGWAY